MQHAQQTSKPALKQNVKILPADPNQAARELVKISNSLLRLADREAQALVQNDLITFTILQDEKELLALRYQRASEEFRTRIQEFKTLDKAQIDQLEAMQKQLNDSLQSNNKMVIRMHTRAEKRTQETLLSAQEIGQNVAVTYPESPEQAANEERAS